MHKSTSKRQPQAKGQHYPIVVLSLFSVFVDILCTKVPQKEGDHDQPDTLAGRSKRDQDQPDTLAGRSKGDHDQPDTLAGRSPDDQAQPDTLAGRTEAQNLKVSSSEFAGGEV